MRLLIALLLLPCVWLSALGAPVMTTLTVQGAIKLLPKDQAKNLVRIEARDGMPAPDRWYIEVYDPTSENGLREYVVWQKSLVAARTLSQFLDGAKAEDVIGAKLLRIDSDDLIKVVQQYVETNNLDVAKINYTLLKAADNPSPVWKITCMDDSGKVLAGIVINARNASVVSHDGFDLVPGQAAKPALPVAASPSPQPGAPAVKPATAVPIATAVTPAPSPAASASPARSPTPAPTQTPTPKRGLLQRMFGGKPAAASPAATLAPRNH